jgi:ParB-like chromosome segregation protein Spo0J
VQSLEYHDAANIFPLDEESIPDLADDIRKEGLHVPIELLDGKILDGRRRYLACNRAGVQPKFREVYVADPVAYVLSINLHRRHLTPSQRSMVGARAREWYDQQAKERQRASGGDRRSGKSVPVTVPEPIKADARDQAGKAVGVSGKLIDYATKVLNSAIPEVVKAVDEGRMSARTAAELTTEPEEVQRKEAAHPQRKRQYGPGPGGARVKKSADDGQDSEPEPESDYDPDNNPEDRKSRGKGVALAHEAINCLSRIPKNDALRKRGFQLVTDWIRRNP